ncbi:hypothetical protein E4U32_007603 [Claviceps aff. humidiphila group G2b]|nr:hypothetical protein E4U32_007603 [Claviceps aff. humidiphila group G2b]
MSGFWASGSSRTANAPCIQTPETLQAQGDQPIELIAVFTPRGPKLLSGWISSIVLPSWTRPAKRVRYAASGWQE